MKSGENNADMALLRKTLFYNFATKLNSDSYDETLCLLDMPCVAAVVRN